MADAATAQSPQLSATQLRRLKDKDAWDAFWQVRDLDTKGTILPRMKYWVQRYVFDAPITYVAENVIQPLHDKYRPVYYHRKLTRVPDIDQCGVNDEACVFEANEQFRLDRMVDTYIMEILIDRSHRCFQQHTPYLNPCINTFEEYEEAELNWFIKYGELGSATDATDVYMKQKHRMIWERRHPEIMAEREKKYKEHKEKLAQGIFEHRFWKGGLVHMDKKKLEPYDFDQSKGTSEGDKPLSKNWEYYKKLAQDPTFDVQQGKTSNVPIF